MQRASDSLTFNLQDEVSNIFCSSLARQLVEYPHGNGLEVIFAGGRKKMTSSNDTDPEYPDKTGERLDGRNLIKEWVHKHPNSQYVWNKTAFDEIDAGQVDHVMGEFLEGFGKTGLFLQGERLYAEVRTFFMEF